MNDKAVNEEGTTQRAETPHGFSALATGTHLDRYVIGSVIAAGGFGITYVAHHDGLGRTCDRRRLAAEEEARLAQQRQRASEAEGRARQAERDAEAAIRRSKQQADDGAHRARTAAAAATAPAAGRITRQANRFVKGDGYAIFPGGAYADCEQRCLADARCTMLEYYFGTENGGIKCNLFDHRTIEKGTSTDSHVGLKAP